jgi:hypothetical protein
VEHGPQPAELAVQVNVAPANRRERARVGSAALAKDGVLDRSIG